MEAKPGIWIEHSNNLLINYVENDVDIGHGWEYKDESETAADFSHPGDKTWCSRNLSMALWEIMLV